MKSRQLTAVLEKVDRWPEAAQDELALIAREIDAGLGGAPYEPTDDELAGIDRGLSDAEQGRFASDERVEAAFAAFRRK
jgi:predicted transcriptional regulator